VKKNSPARASKLIFIVIFLFAFFLRTLNINWDQGQHLHPDERFLTMVMGNMVMPNSLEEYLDPAVSKLNPINIGHEFFVYGTLPLVLNKVLAILLGLDNYGDLTLLGRALSAIADSLGLVALVFFVRNLERRYSFSADVKYLTGIMYAISVIPIQQSHFFTVDTFANAFFLISLCFASNVQLKKGTRWVVLSALSMGLSIASKVNVVLTVPLVGWFLVEPFLLELLHFKKVKKSVIMIGLLSVMWFLILIMTVRIAEPYYFASSLLIDFSIHPKFLSSISTLKSFSDPKGYFPPSIQWINKTPILFPLFNIAIFGVGIPFFFFLIIGAGQLFKHAIKAWKKKLGILILLCWCTGFFLYQGTQFVTTLRYFLPLFGFFALFAGMGISELSEGIAIKLKKDSLHQPLGVFFFLTCLIWPLMFLSIYTKLHSRVQASNWMYQVFPDKTKIAFEHWDDPLPIMTEGSNPQNKTIEGTELPVFYPDNEEKWKEMEEVFSEVDYYILSSNRGWGSISSVPDRYPRMSQFYQDLFDGKTQFTKVAEFSSYPSLMYLGIPLTLSDDWAEEAFSVYDHPKVYVFRNEK
jgi:hypothetical protein